MSEEALQITEKRREAKGKEKYSAECRVSRRTNRDKKEFFNEQCKKVKENNRMGKTRDLFKKIGAIKGTLHARMGTIKDRNSKDLTEAEEIKKRWQEYTELYKKSVDDPDNHSGVLTHLESDTTECKVKWALAAL